MLKLNIKKYTSFIENFDEYNIKKNKKFLKLLLKNNNFRNFLSSDIRYCYYFCKWVIGGRCEILEDFFILDSCYSLHYAGLLGEKLPEKLHNSMVLKYLSDKDDCAKRYFIWLSTTNKKDIGVWGEYI